MFKIGKIIVNEVRDENIPLFPLDDIVLKTDTITEDQIFERIERHFNLTILVMLAEAVNNNKTFVPWNTVEIKKIWENSCTRNSLTIRDFKITGNNYSLRSVESPVVILDSVPQEGYEKYNDYLWVKTEKFEGGVNYYTQAQIRISSLTDQSQFGLA